MNNSENEKNLLEQYRQDMHMNDSEYYFFCKRYYNRNVSSVVEILKKLYGKTLSHQKLKKAMYDVVENV